MTIIIICLTFLYHYVRYRASHYSNSITLVFSYTPNPSSQRDLHCLAKLVLVHILFAQCLGGESGPEVGIHRSNLISVRYDELDGRWAENDSILSQYHRHHPPTSSGQPAPFWHAHTLCSLTLLVTHRQKGRLLIRHTVQEKNRIFAVFQLLIVASWTTSSFDRDSLVFHPSNHDIDITFQISFKPI